MSVDLDTVARTITRATEELAEASRFRWVKRSGGAIGFCSTAPFPLGNGVVVDALDPSVDAVADLLDEVADSGYPPFLEIRPGADPGLAELAAERDMQPEADQPLMLRRQLRDLPKLPAPDGVAVEPNGAAGHRLYARLFGEGFDAPPEIARQFADPQALQTPGLRRYVGTVDGEPAAVGAGHVLGAGMMVANVATTPAQRRRGLATAITLQALRDGRDDGAEWACLFATPSGYRIYRRLGFTEVEAWRVWTSA